MRLSEFLNLTRIYDLQRKPEGVLRMQAWLDEAIKRAFDVCASFVGLVLLSPFFALIAWAIKRDSPGPVFYRGERIGRKGKTFQILKFRTMYEAPESYSGPRVTAQDDCRVTPLGAWLRDTKLNELPQLWNVLKGEMSMVGPRPEDPTIAKTWPREAWSEVLSVRPGVTSPASVHYHNEENLLSYASVMKTYLQELSPDKMRMDRLYVRYRSFWLDLDTLLWTFMIFVPRLRTYSPPEKFLYYGPVTQLARRYLSWFSIDLLITLFSIGLSGMIWRLSEPLNVGRLEAFALALSFALLFSLSGAALGVNRISWSRARPRDALDLLPPWGLALVVALALNQFYGFFPAALLILAAFMALMGFFLARYRSRVLTGVLSYIIRMTGVALLPRERVLIVGGGPCAEMAAWLMDHPTNARSYQVVGFADDELLKQGLRTYGARVLGTISEVPGLVQEHDIGVLIVTDPGIPADVYMAIFELQQKSHFRLVILPDMLAALDCFSRGEKNGVQTVEGNEDEDFVPCSYCLVMKAMLGTKK